MNSALFFVNYQIFFCGLKACFGLLLWQRVKVLFYSFQVLKVFRSRWEKWGRQELIFTVTKIDALLFVAGRRLRPSQIFFRISGYRFHNGISFLVFHLLYSRLLPMMLIHNRGEPLYLVSSSHNNPMLLMLLHYHPHYKVP